MNDKKWIILGLIIFFGMCSSIGWYKLIAGDSAEHEPVITEKTRAMGDCVMPKAKMKVEHMKLLDVWRDRVVRYAEREYETEDGKKFNMSLSTGEESCMGCHSNKTEFCDRCHDYASVRPYCWDCHLEPKEKE